MKKIIKLISLLCVIAIISTLALSSCNLINPNPVVMSCGDREVTANMMSYYCYSEYIDFANTYSTYLPYFSIDQTKDLKEQQFGADGYYDAMFLGEFSGTWFEYFLQEAKKNAKEYLIYAAEADALGIALDESDKAEIEESLNDLISQLPSEKANDSESKRISKNYGDGVTRDDIRMAMELFALAAKTSLHISETIEASITAERISKTYAENKLEFDIVDCYTYTFEIKYDDVAEELYPNTSINNLNGEEEMKVKALYEEKISNARKAANELVKINDISEFIAYAAEYENISSSSSELEKFTKDMHTSYGYVDSDDAFSVWAFASDRKANDTFKSDELLDEYEYRVEVDIIEKTAHKDETLARNVAYMTFNNEQSATRVIETLSTIENLDKDKFLALANDPKFSATSSAYEEECFHPIEANYDNLEDWLLSAEEGEYTTTPIARNYSLKFTRYKNPKTPIKFIESRNYSVNTYGMTFSANSTITTKDVIIGSSSKDITSIGNGVIISNSAVLDKYNATINDSVSDILTAHLGSKYMVAYYVGDGKITAWEYEVEIYIYNSEIAAYEKKIETEHAHKIVINDQAIDEICEP